jgi:hypothetical protein
VVHEQVLAPALKVESALQERQFVERGPEQVAQEVSQARQFPVVASKTQPGLHVHWPKFREAFGLQPVQELDDAAVHVWQVLSQAVQARVTGSGKNPSLHKQLDLVGTAASVAGQVRQPLELADMKQVWQVVWQLAQSPVKVIAFPGGQTQAPFNKVAVALQEVQTKLFEPSRPQVAQEK